MKALYVTSIQTFSGKTAVCLALGRKLQKNGHRVGYFKPLSAQPWEPVPGRTMDEDADFVRQALGLTESSQELVGATLTLSLLRETLCASPSNELMARVQAAYQRLAADKDILLLEGGASLREGVCIGLGPAQVAETLDVPALVVVRFRNEMSLVDDCLVADLRLGQRLAGILVNAVPNRAQEFVNDIVRPCLEKRGVPVLGVFPAKEELQAISVGELAEVLKAEFLTMPEKKDVLIENMIVGAMSVEQALPRLRRVPGSKAVITGGDRADIQLVALETATSCLILTGHLRPMPEVLRRAEEAGVPILLVRENTLETVEAIDRVFGKTRLGQSEKLEQFEALLEKHLDMDRLCQRAGF